MFWHMMRKPLDLHHNLQLLLSYSLGTAVVSYAYGWIDWSIYFLGLLTVVSLSIVMGLVEEYFFTEADLLSRLSELLKLNEARKPGDGIIIDRPKYLFLVLALPFLLLFFLGIWSLFRSGAINGGAFAILLLIAVLTGLAAKPPWHLAQSKFSDLIDGFATILLPAGFGNLLQADNYVDLSILLSISLLILFFALRIVLGLETYDEDERMERETFLTAIGWERGMQLHNIFLLIAFFLPALALVVLNFPWEIFWPLLLAFASAMLQLFQMIRIHNGAPVNWRLMRFTAFATFYLFIYLAIITLILR